MNTMKTILLFFAAALITIGAQAQTISANGDTINKTDALGMKQGYWEESVGGVNTKGYYVDGLKDGSWSTYSAKSVVTKVETYKLGKKNGITVNIDDNGYFKGESYYENDLMNGLARTYSVGARLLSEVNYKDNMVNGLKKTYYEAGKIQEEAYYKMGVRDSVTKWYKSNGVIMAQYYYMKGSFNGINKTFSDTGNVVKEETYVDNILNGAYKEYFDTKESKVKLIGMYKNGMKEGEWIEYDEKGVAIKTTTWKKGEMKK
jgi:uncharacterized protein